MIKYKKILIIAGMTGLGKTELAYKLAKTTQTKVIVGDALQVFNFIKCRSIKIGLSLVIIHLQNINRNQTIMVQVKLMSTSSRQQQWSILNINYCYKNQVLDYISKVTEEHLIIEGGTCFYLDYLLNSKSEKFTTEQIKHSYELLQNITRDNKPLSEVLTQICSSYDNSIDPHDTYRLEKAIRYALLTNGSQFSVNTYNEAGFSLKESHDIRGVFLYGNTSFVQPIIDKRCDQMISDGFLQEFIHYMGSPHQVQILPIGYKETMSFFNKIIDHFNTIHYHSKQTKTKILNSMVKQYVLEFQTKTRQYALYQRKYFRQKEASFIWHDMNVPLKEQDIKQIWDLDRKDYDNLVNHDSNQNKMKSTQDPQINKTIRSVPLETNFTEVMQTILGEIIPKVRDMKKFDKKQYMMD